MQNETIEYRNCNIVVFQDQFAENPREYCDNLSSVVLSHKRYEFPNESDVSVSACTSWKEVEKEIIRLHGPSIILPVYMYDHSGITINTTGFSCPWDSGQLGLIFVPLSKVREEYHCKRVTLKIQEKVIAVLRQEIADYDCYLRGDIWEYVIFHNGKNIASCGGFYGDVEQAVQDAKIAIDDICTIEQVNISLDIFTAITTGIPAYCNNAEAVLIAHNLLEKYDVIEPTEITGVYSGIIVNN